MTATLRSILEQFPYWQNAAMPAPLADRARHRIVIGCGTSYNLSLSVAAAMNGRGIPAMAVPAGEWLVRPDNYLAAWPPERVEVIAMSRSGETTETVLAAKASQSLGYSVLGITCAPGSALSGASDRVIEMANPS